jgi:hypothetical protein
MAPGAEDTLQEELGSLLDEVSFQITSARWAGLDRVEELRASLKRARDLIADADALAAGVAADRREREW